MVSDQGEKSLSPQLFAQNNKVGRMLKPKNLVFAKSRGGKMTKKTENERKINGQVADSELQARQVL